MCVNVRVCVFVCLCFSAFVCVNVCLCELRASVCRLWFLREIPVVCVCVFVCLCVIVCRVCLGV